MLIKTASLEQLHQDVKIQSNVTATVAAKLGIDLAEFLKIKTLEHFQRNCSPELALRKYKHYQAYVRSTLLAIKQGRDLEFRRNPQFTAPVQLHIESQREFNSERQQQRNQSDDKLSHVLLYQKSLKRKEQLALEESRRKVLFKRILNRGQKVVQNSKLQASKKHKTEQESQEHPKNSLVQPKQVAFPSSHKLVFGKTEGKASFSRPLSPPRRQVKRTVLKSVNPKRRKAATNLGLLQNILNKISRTTKRHEELLMQRKSLCFKDRESRSVRAQERREAQLEKQLLRSDQLMRRTFFDQRRSRTRNHTEERSASHQSKRSQELVAAPSKEMSKPAAHSQHQRRRSPMPQNDKEAARQRLLQKSTQLQLRLKEKLQKIDQQKQLWKVQQAAKENYRRLKIQQKERSTEFKIMRIRQKLQTDSGNIRKRNLDKEQNLRNLMDERLKYKLKMERLWAENLSLPKPAPTRSEATPVPEVVKEV